MKSSNGTQVVGGSFREQVATVSNWFDEWNPCEQTVALYSLLKKLGPVQGRFLGLCLSQQGLQSSKETRITEQNANDPAFVRQLDGAEQLVPHLPLLRPGNEAAKRVYLEQIPRALASAVDSSRAVEQARQLLSYALIHPALGSDERKLLGLLMSMSYEQMLALTDDQLEAHGVTQGARNKLMLNISKLTQRQRRLATLQKDVDRGEADLKQVFDEIRAMLVTPIKAYPVSGQDCGAGENAGGANGLQSDAPSQTGSGVVVDDIPSEMTRLLGKLCSTLLVSPLLDHNGLVPAYVQLLDRCLAHEQFCPMLKRRLYSWKQQMARFGTRRRPFTLPWSGKEGPMTCGGLLGPPTTTTTTTTTAETDLGGGPPSRGTNTLPVFGAARLPSHVQHIMEPEYEDRLESLCLSMTAHAIGDTFNT
ncbi:protein Smaug1-like [Tropilaelaps mercedesae]|uniref:Protein Smaug1-like n=1 Tax=Tropilaelaps mercedesae TaxID=418985 RepID=A0A1V9XF14_9ACAR|nr:protein Smaug1-like [Tropilaelaps mercedesae]